nr:MAG TPA: hypothetical protein [Caudoviricetes sp.]
MNTKIYSIGKVKLTMESNGFPKGFILKRDLTVRECRYILYSLLGINIATKDDLDDEEYREQNEEYVQTVNAWLRGETDDSAIIEFAFDCSDEPLGLMNMLPIVAYLQKKGII